MVLGIPITYWYWLVLNSDYVSFRFQVSLIEIAWFQIGLGFFKVGIGWFQVGNGWFQVERGLFQVKIIRF